MILAKANELGPELPVTTLVDGYCQEIQEMGGARWETSSLYARMEMAGSDCQIDRLKKSSKGIDNEPG